MEGLLEGLLIRVLVAIITSKVVYWIWRKKNG